MMIEFLNIVIYTLISVLLFGGVAVAFFIFALALYDASKTEFNKTLDLARNCKLYNFAYNYFKKKYN